MSIVVLCPMQIEHKAVSRALRAANLAHVPVVQTGIGREAILHALAVAAAKHGPGSLYILAGACGGLTTTEDVPPIARVIDERGGTWKPFNAAPSDTGIALIGVDGIIATPADKRDLHSRTGAAIVDMESHAFAAECERRGLAWSVVRGVSDTPDETLPPQVLGWIRPDGGTHAARAAIDLVRKPSLVPHIVGVVRRANRVLPKVGAQVAATCTAWEALGTSPDRAKPANTDIAPLPIDPGATTAIIYGGTFDPPHLAHIELPQRVREFVEQRDQSTGRVWLVYVPAARSPHKAGGPVAADADRVAMLALSFNAGGPRGGRVERACIWIDELERARQSPDAPSFTIDTLLRARAWLDANERGHIKLRLLIGGDQAAKFHQWREPRRIIELAEPLVMARADAGPQSGETDHADTIITALRASGFWSEVELAAWRTRIVQVGLIEASATAVRAALAAGRTSDAAKMLPPPVAQYINERGLYR